MHLSLIILLFIIFVQTSNGRIFTIIPPNDEVCFEEQVDEGVPGLKGSFEVIEGGQLDVDLLITKNGQQVHAEAYARQGDIDIAKGSGRYKVCFGNRMSSVTEKHVGFSLHGSLGELIEDEDVAKKEHVRPITIQIQSLADKIQKLQEHERYLNERLNRHMQTAESTAARVLVSTGIEAVVLVVVNLAQILYLRRYFERRRAM
jgi:hypothetical protein